MSDFRHPRIASMLFNVPLLLDEAKGDILLDVFQRYDQGAQSIAVNNIAVVDAPAYTEELLGVRAERMDAGYMRTADGVAVLPVFGSLVHRGSSMDAMSGLMSYSRLSSMLDAALSDHKVKGIVMEVDSPGGTSAGIFETAAMIRAAGTIKPVHAIANEQALSGGYMLLSAANKAYVTEPGMVGSVGVIMYHMDRSKQLEKQGVVVTPIYAGARKADFSPAHPLSAEAKAWAEDSVNRTYERFTKAVATYRGIDAKVVKKTEAGLLHSDQAMSLRMVDGVSTLAKVIESVAEAGTAPHRVFQGSAVGADAAASALSTAEEQQPMDPKDVAANGGAAPVLTHTQAQINEATAAARTEGMTAERTRISGILNSEHAKTRQSLARHLATKTDLSVDAAVATLQAAPAEASATPTSTFAAAMGGVPNPAIDASSGAQGDGGPVEKKTAATIDSSSIFNARREAAEKARGGSH